MKKTTFTLISKCCLLGMLSFLLAACGDSTVSSVARSTGGSPAKAAPIRVDDIMELLIHVEYLNTKYYVVARRDADITVMSGSKTAQSGISEPLYQVEMERLFAGAAEAAKHALPAHVAKKMFPGKSAVTIICKEAVYVLPFAPESGRYTDILFDVVNPAGGIAKKMLENEAASRQMARVLTPTKEVVVQR